MSKAKMLRNFQKRNPHLDDPFCVNDYINTWLISSAHATQSSAEKILEIWHFRLKLQTIKMAATVNLMSDVEGMNMQDSSDDVKVMSK